jgi:hypothetical protein
MKSGRWQRSLNIKCTKGVGSTAKKLGGSRRTVAGGELVNEEWQVAEVSTYKVYQGWAARPIKLGIFKHVKSRAAVSEVGTNTKMYAC